ncbi:hypothetical protein YK48G_18550 [Lentilactobacillus fungorum]|uniref:ATP-dependent DNA helicase RecG C-terminal domain-containing protein n=1 Tax=Lentilactobacillus fungorum TaxID=2201250 RepID=A0ABQ3W0S7_9LACO|nr:ATP-binding protein [Lentilactobacillus fungorum]GHP14430.1 hypothetical protein YK48G_18550 [Lentilactobacillus fungorum]
MIEKLPLGIRDYFSQDEKLTRGSYIADLRQAVKEALVNSLMHPYYDSHSPIRIVDRKSYFEFYNPGDTRISIDSFIRGNDPQPRNTIISTLFRKVGISEKAGSGGPRIFESAARNHLHVPDVDLGSLSTKIRIWKIDLLSSLEDGLDLTDDEASVIKIVADSNSITVKKLAKIFETKSEYQIRQLINTLMGYGVCRKLGMALQRGTCLKQLQNKTRLKQLECLSNLKIVCLNDDKNLI